MTETAKAIVQLGFMAIASAGFIVGSCWIIKKYFDKQEAGDISKEASISELTENLKTESSTKNQLTLEFLQSTNNFSRVVENHMVHEEDEFKRLCKTIEKLCDKIDK